MDEFFRSQIRRLGITNPNAYTPYAAGRKLYGYGRSNPTSGAIGTDGMAGYRERDRRTRLRRQNSLAKMQAAQQNQYLSPQFLGSNGAY
jgi:hypothetical protein